MKTDERMVLLLLRVCPDLLDDATLHDGTDLRVRLAKLLAQARAAGLPVIYAPYRGEAIDVALAAQSGDLILPWEGAHPFQQTGLALELAARGARHVLLAGLHTEWEVDGCARAAAALGYAVTLVADGHSTRAGVLPAAQIVAHHNHVLKQVARVLPLDALVLMPPDPQPDLKLLEPFAPADLAALRQGLAELTHGRIPYTHPINALNVLRHAWDPTFIPPMYRLAPAEWQVGTSQTLTETLRQPGGVWQKLVGTEATAVAQQALKSILQTPDGQTRPISSALPLFCYQATHFRLIYHQDEAQKRLTLLAVAANAVLPRENPMDQFRKRFGLA